jgi:hypothetical protein
MRLKVGTATVLSSEARRAKGDLVASSRRPAGWRRSQNHSHVGEPFRGADAFGGTPKAAGEDARAPQSIRIVTLIPYLALKRGFLPACSMLKCDLITLFC